MTILSHFHAIAKVRDTCAKRKSPRRCAKIFNNMEIRRLTQEYFPSALLEIPSPPEEIWVEGNLPEPDDDCIFLAVVGTRKFSNYGKDACEKIISGLAGYNIVIVSGLALGIDAIAHRAALNARLKTIAIPGSGLSRKVLHPRSNHKLADEIVEAGGCLLSEFPPDYPAGLHTFPQRNRIIAGLSRATLIIEAPEKSGALITAKFALDFNRDVMAVPGSIFNENAKGTNGYIKMGAIPITCAEDILNAFNIALPGENLKLGFDQKLSFEGAQKLSFNNPTENEIWNALSEPMPKDELIRKIGKPAHEINPALTLMQLNGLIKESGGEIRKN
jgi:DNA processing protein